MRSLLVLSMLMTETEDDHRILQLAITAVPSLASAHPWGVYMEETGWRVLVADPDSSERARVGQQVRGLVQGGGTLELPARGWGYAYPLRSLEGHQGHLVVSAPTAPTADEQFLLRALAQQVGVALANAQLHVQQGHAAEELARANVALQETVSALQRRMEIHERLTEVVLSGGGVADIAKAVHDVTGHPVGIEDQHGNLQVWWGQEIPKPYPADEPAQRAKVLQRAARSGRPIRHGDRLIAPARPREEVLGVLVLFDPEHTAGEHKLIALEHGATVLAMELAHLRSLAESDLRLARDLMDELLTDPDRERVLTRAQALGCDLKRAHRVVLVSDDAPSDRDGLVRALRGAAESWQPSALVGPVEQGAALLADPALDWTALQAAVSEKRGWLCDVGVGGVAEAVEDFPTSYREASLALRLQQSTARTSEVRPFEELGVYRLLAAVDNPAHVEKFVHDWLGSLIDYDRRKNYELVLTLARYLEQGGQYAATAAALNIHRNTLKYRLRRIHEISGHDLRDPFTRFNLQLATSAWETLRTLRP